MILARQNWESLIPHKGAMCLFDAVVAWNDSSVHASTASHRDSSNPLRTDGILRSVHLCEYGAQAMAIHGGLLAQRDGRVATPGLLVSLRVVKLHIERIDELPDKINVYAEKLLDSRTSWQYAFRVVHAGRVVAEGRAAVMMQS